MNLRRALFLLLLMLAAGCVGAGRVSHASPPEGYLDLAALLESCQVPGDCGTPLRCEGESVLVSGSIDYDNVFDRSRYPQLPYEKFLLVGEAGQKVDVFAVSPDNAALFRSVFAARAQGRHRAYLKATILGIELPVMGACHKGVRLELVGPLDIAFR